MIHDLPHKIGILCTESLVISRFCSMKIQKDLEGLLLQGLHNLVVVEARHLYPIEDKEIYLGTIFIIPTQWYRWASESDPAGRG